ncbi:hypothetical protein ABPG72_014577 [Tetrahymena utriculariae]
MIEGTLSIKDSISMNIKYKDFTLQDVSGNSCEEPTNTQSVGKINIQSRYFEAYNLNDILKSQNIIRMQNKPVNILSKQNYVLFDSLSFGETEQLINIQDVQEQNLMLKESILQDNLLVLINDDIVVNLILFSDVPTFSKVIFKNSCLVGNIDKFQGVTLINPRGLYLKGRLIQSSLIKVEHQDKQISRKIKSQGGFQIIQ